VFFLVVFSNVICRRIKITKQRNAAYHKQHLLRMRRGIFYTSVEHKCNRDQRPAHIKILSSVKQFDPLKPELNPICYLLALLGTHHFLHVSRIRVKSLTFRLLMSYIYMGHPFLMFLDHIQRRSTVGRTPLDE